MGKDTKNILVVVTGGAEGIGFEIANNFLQNGAKAAIILDINEATGNEAASKLNKQYGEDKAHFFKCDVTADLEKVSEGIYDKFGSVDVLVNNAGVANFNSDVEVDVNLKAVIKWSYNFWERMKNDKNGKGGTILNISSIYGINVEPYSPVYSATKFGVIGFSQALGHKINFNASKVRVVTLCPGFTKTRFVQFDKQKTFNDKDLLEHLAVSSKALIWQNAEAVGVAAVKVFKEAGSGEVWKIEGGDLEKLK